MTITDLLRSGSYTSLHFHIESTIAAIRRAGFGVRLIGVNSGETPMPLRRKIWGRLASDLKPRRLAAIAHDITLEALPAYFDKMLKGQIRGRAVVRL